MSRHLAVRVRWGRCWEERGAEAITGNQSCNHWVNNTRNTFIIISEICNDKTIFFGTITVKYLSQGIPKWQFLREALKHNRISNKLKHMHWRNIPGHRRNDTSVEKGLESWGLPRPKELHYKSSPSITHLHYFSPLHLKFLCSWRHSAFCHLQGFNKFIVFFSLGRPPSPLLSTYQVILILKTPLRFFLVSNTSLLSPG